MMCSALKDNYCICVCLQRNVMYTIYGTMSYPDVYDVILGWGRNSVFVRVYVYHVMFFTLIIMIISLCFT